MINVKLKQYLDKHDITIYRLAKDTGISNNNLAKFASGETVSVKYEVLDKVCKALKCKLQDIIEYIE